MKQSRIIILVIAGFAALLIIWRVGFHPPETEQVASAVESKASIKPNKPDEAQTAGDANESKVAFDANEPGRLADVNEPRGPARRPGRMEGDEPGRFAGSDRRRGQGRRPGRGEGDEPGRLAGFEGRRGPGRRPERLGDVNEPNKPADPNELMEALNLKNVEMKNIIQKISEWTGKSVIPSEEAEKVKLTIYAPKKLPRNKALSQIYGALLMKGFVAEHTDDVIYLTPIKDAKLRFVPTIQADQPLAMLENKDQIVQKFFQLENYSPAQMSELIQPLIGEHGYVSVDVTTGNLLVIETVANLMRLERIIREFDVPEAEQTVTEVFEVRYGDPSEIVQMLRMLLGESEGYSSRYRGGYDRGRGGYDRGRGGNPPPPSSGSSPKKGDSKTKTATSVVVGSTRGPIVLIPEPRRKWIIAKASAEDMKQIAVWITKLDKEEPVESEYEIVQLRYADPREVENSIEDGFRDIPGTEFLPSVLVEPLEQTRQVMVFGRKDLREIVKKMIEEIDIPPGQFETRHFPLKYADPDQIKTNIEELFGEQTIRGSSYRTYISYYGGYGSRQRGPVSSDTVKVISYATLKQVTVIASSENMEEIAKQIAEWDKPLDVDELSPRIIELRNSDPVLMAELLNTLFSEKTTGRTSFFDLYFGRTEDKQKIVGPLYGQLTFEDVPGTKKIIVISKIPEAYDVIEKLILDLDRQEMAEVPRVVTLKYADPEDLSERLNAMFNEPGTSARIRLSEQGLSGSSMLEESDESDGDRTSSSNENQSSQDDYTPWWSGSGARSRLDEEMPISNVIGRIRFVPDPHSKSILVLAPPEFIDQIEKLIQDLDIPGKQVLIKAIVVEIAHSNMTSLGVQLATDPEAFGTLGENAITALNALTHLATHGSIAPSTTPTVGATGTGTIFGINTNVYGLLDFLIKKTNAKILNQQSLWTKDNTEANFFKGTKIAFQTETSVADVGTRATSSYVYDRVGMELRVRPSITPEKNVDMIINVILSQLTGDTVSGQRVRTEMDSTTNMIVRDGQTLLLGGILFQEESVVQRKLPLLGDVPLVGSLFRHNDKVESNNEMLIFITPYVIEDPNNIPPQTREQIEKLENVKEQLETTMEELEQKLP